MIEWIRDDDGWHRACDGRLYVMATEGGRWEFNTFLGPERDCVKGYRNTIEEAKTSAEAAYRLLNPEPVKTATGKDLATTLDKWVADGVYESFADADPSALAQELNPEPVGDWREVARETGWDPRCCEQQWNVFVRKGDENTDWVEATVDVGADNEAWWVIHGENRLGEESEVMIKNVDPLKFVQITNLIIKTLGGE